MFISPSPKIMSEDVLLHGVFVRGCVVSLVFLHESVEEVVDVGVVVVEVFRHRVVVTVTFEIRRIIFIGLSIISGNSK